jgi:hypothetical protein
MQFRAYSAAAARARRRDQRDTLTLMRGAAGDNKAYKAVAKALSDG